MRENVIRYRHYLLGVLHSALIAIAFLGSFALRFDLEVPPPYDAAMWSALPLVVPSKIIVFYWFNLFQGWWQYVGLRDLIDIGKAALIGSLATLVALYFSQALPGVPRAVLLVDLVLTFLLVGGVRFAVRAYTETIRKSSASAQTTRVLIVGAGSTGHALVRQMRTNPRVHYEPVGFVDDDTTKHRMQIEGLRVLGPTSLIPEVVVGSSVGLILLAIPSATGKQMRAVTEICQRTGVPFKTIPAFGDLIEGRVSISRLRHVQIEDLLGREPVRPDLESIRRNVTDQCIMITGAAGSIGSELATQIVSLGPAHLVLLDRAESDLHDLELVVRRACPEARVTAVVADILNRAEIDELFEVYRPSRVYHAAAYKHVWMMERHIVSAIRHNVLGTANVARAATLVGTEQFVLISSDKAVRPTSLMGATKRAAERILLGMTGGRTRLIAVRFGNVLGSRGSVVPIFRQQIAAGGPVTVTHPDVVRYFMTVSEAVQLVLQASAMSDGREIFHLDMGDPVRIVDLAENMIRLSGFEPGTEVEIVFTGLQPGEKLYEELLITGEGVLPTAHPRIRVILPADPGVDVEWLEAVEGKAAARDVPELVRLLRQAVPEYEPSEVVRSSLIRPVTNATFTAPL